jgi:ferrochelatase
VRWCIVNFAILPRRPAQSAAAYQKIWTSEGSPLVAISRKVRDALQASVGLPVELAMRYRNPSIPDAIRRLRDQRIRELLLIPLFPHYAMSSYETAVVRVRQVIARLAPDISLSVAPPFYDHPDYIRAMTANAVVYLTHPYDHLLFSFHGLPERHMRKSDPTGAHCLSRPDCCADAGPALDTCYRAQCFKTVEAFVRAASIPKDKFSIAFQSRLGRQPWLKPHTDVVLEELARSGIRKLAVICPSFVSDCLETLEEIGIRGRESFRAAGGDELTLVPCLNTHPLWIATLHNMARLGSTGDSPVPVGDSPTGSVSSKVSP